MKYLVLPVLLFLFACKEEPANDLVQKKLSPAQSEAEVNAGTDTDNCPADKAHPIIKKSAYPKAFFKLLADGRSGLETVTLDSGDKLTISYSGCEYVSLHFKFDRMRNSPPTTTMEGYLNTIDFMTQLIPSIERPLTMEDSIMALTHYVSKANGKTDAMHYDEEITVNDDDIPSTIIVHKPGESEDGRYIQEFTYSIGPL